MKMAQQMTLFPDATRNWASDQRRRSRPARPRPDGRGRHTNSLAAHDAVDAALAKRRQAVLDYVSAHGPMTIREILRGMFPGSDNMDLVRPRVSELLSSGELVEHDSVIDAETGRPVMRVAARA